MVQRELLDYVSSSFKRGFSPEQIRLNLLAQGKSDYDIHEAMKAYESGSKEEIKRVHKKNPFSKLKWIVIFSLFTLILFIFLIYFLSN